MTSRNGGKRINRYYVPCKVQPGMFENELLVIFDGADPSAGGQPVRIQVLVDAKLVDKLKGSPQRGREVDGLLLVELIEKVQDWALIALPQPAIPVGDTAVVRKNQLVPATS